jgi:hypothetical protein
MFTKILEGNRVRIFTQTGSKPALEERFPSLPVHASIDKAPYGASVKHYAEQKCGLLLNILSNMQRHEASAYAIQLCLKLFIGLSLTLCGQVRCYFHRNRRHCVI